MASIFLYHIESSESPFGPFRKGQHSYPADTPCSLDAVKRYAVRRRRKNERPRMKGKRSTHLDDAIDGETGNRTQNLLHSTRGSETSMLRRCHTTRPYPLEPIAWFVENGAVNTNYQANCNYQARNAGPAHVG